MITQDWEHEAQKDLIYLQEHIEFIKRELRKEAIVQSSLEKISQHANKQVAEVRRITPEGLQSGPDVHSETNIDWE